MLHVKWIDIEDESEGKATVTVCVSRELKKDELPGLTIERLGDGGVGWKVAPKDPVRDYDSMKHRTVNGEHHYTFEWNVEDHAPNNPAGIWRFTQYYGGEYVIASDEFLAIPETAAKAKGSIVSQGEGAMPDRRKKVAGASFLTTECVVRAVYARTSRGAQMLAKASRGDQVDLPHPAMIDFVENKKGMWVGVVGKKGDDPLTWTWDVKRFEIDDQGYICKPEELVRNTLVGRRVHMFNSPFLSVEEGDMSQSIHLPYTWFFVLLADHEQELDVRLRVIKDALHQPDKSLRVHTIQVMADSFIQYNGAPHPYTFYAYEDYYDQYPDFGPRQKVEGRQVLQFFIPLKYSPSGEVYDILSRFVEEQNVDLKRLAEVKDFEAEDIYTKDHGPIYQIYSRITDPDAYQKDAEADRLVDDVRTYFKNHPEDAHMLTAMPIPRLLRQLDYGLTLVLRDQFQGILFKPEEMTKREYHKGWKTVLEAIEAVTPKVLAIFCMGIYEYLRLDVAYPMGKEMIEGIVSFYQRYFDQDLEGGDIAYRKRSGASEKFGKLAGNLALEYYLGYQRAQRAGENKSVRLRRFEENFRLRLLPLGIYEDSADSIVRQLHGHLAGKSNAEVAQYIQNVFEGKDPEVLRDRIVPPMKEVARKMHSLRSNFYNETKLDIYNQYSLFRDYPRLTKKIYDAFDIRLDASAHPGGFGELLGGKDKPDHMDDLDKLRLGEYAMFKCGKLQEEQNDFAEYYASFLQFLLSVASMQLLAIRPGTSLATSREVVVEAVEGLGGVFSDFVKGWGKTDAAYAKAIAGLDKLGKAKEEKASLYFDTIFGLAEVVAGAGSKMAGKEDSNPMPWLALDSAFAEVIKRSYRDRRAGLKYGPSQVLGDTLSKHVKNKEVRRKIHRGMQHTVEMAVQKYELDHTLIEKGTEQIGKMGAKNFLQTIYLEAALRAEIDDDYAMLRDLEEPLKDLSEAMKALSKE